MIKRIYESHDVCKTSTPLPAIDWSMVGDYHAPTVLPTPSDQLPPADIAIVTWTDAEWSALDQVFVHSDQPRKPDDKRWMESWQSYTFKGESGPWLFYQLVEVKRAEQTLKVLLIKSEVHLAYPPYIAGLTKAMARIVEESKPAVMISAGTAGGANVHQPLGDVILTCAAHLQLTSPENLPCAYNDTTITGKNLFTSDMLYSQVKGRLMMPMASVWTVAQINQAVTDLNANEKLPAHPQYTSADLINSPLNPAELTTAHLQLAGVKPLLTTDTFYIASAADAKTYCCLEMDDAVIAHVCQQADTAFGFVRNISDPVVPFNDQAGNPIDPVVRNAWSEEIYEICGLYSSFNGALGCWAALQTMVIPERG